MIKYFFHLKSFEIFHYKYIFLTIIFRSSNTTNRAWIYGFYIIPYILWKIFNIGQVKVPTIDGHSKGSTLYHKNAPVLIKSWHIEVRKICPRRDLYVWRPGCSKIIPRRWRWGVDVATSVQYWRQAFCVQCLKASFLYGYAGDLEGLALKLKFRYIRWHCILWLRHCL